MPAPARPPGHECPGHIGLIFVDDFAAYDRCYYFARELPAIEGGVVGFRERLRGVVGPTLLGVEDRYIGVRAFDERTAAVEVVVEIEDARRTGREEFDDACERDGVIFV